MSAASFILCCAACLDSAASAESCSLVELAASIAKLTAGEAGGCMGVPGPTDGPFGIRATPAAPFCTGAFEYSLQT